MPQGFARHALRDFSISDRAGCRRYVGPRCSDECDFGLGPDAGSGTQRFSGSRQVQRLNRLATSWRGGGEFGRSNCSSRQDFFLGRGTQGIGLHSAAWRIHAYLAWLRKWLAGRGRLDLRDDPGQQSQADDRRTPCRRSATPAGSPPEGRKEQKRRSASGCSADHAFGKLHRQLAVAGQELTQASALKRRDQHRHAGDALACFGREGCGTGHPA
jgi:hypothetical protein